MLSVALTGGIGSGKSAVTELFLQSAQEQNLKVIDADKIARSLLQGSLHHSPSPALLQVKELFGEQLFDSSGKLKRAQLRELIFNSADKKQQLEDLLHPLVYQALFDQITIFRKQKNNTIVISDIPLFFETAFKTGQAQQFDRILVVDVPESVQIARTLQRDHCSRELVEQIIQSQVDRETRLQQADDIIDNSGSLAQLQSRVEQLYRFYRQLADGK